MQGILKEWGIAMLTKVLIKCTFRKVACMTETQVGVWWQCPQPLEADKGNIWGESLNCWANFGFLLAKITTFGDNF